MSFLNFTSDVVALMILTQQKSIHWTLERSGQMVRILMLQDTDDFIKYSLTHPQSISMTYFNYIELDGDRPRRLSNH